MHFPSQQRATFSSAVPAVLLRHNGEGQKKTQLAVLGFFNSGKVDIVTINDPFVYPFVYLNYTVYMLQYDSNHTKFNGTISLALKTQ